MAASSSSSSRLWSYDVFPSFRGKDVRNTFLSHCYKEFQRKGIKTFEDQKIRRGQTIRPELKQAIRESRISIVVLSKNYASSSWCLDELLEIMDCRDTEGRRVMAIFHGVDPRDVRNQTGDFGEAFKVTCARKTKGDEKKQRWCKALTEVGNIAGYHYVPERDNEAKMIERIVAEVSKELNYSIVLGDFDDLVGIGTHLDKISSLLCLQSNEVRLVGIWGPAGIGKTTLARVIYNQLSISGNFQLIYFMDDIGKTFRRPYFNLYKYNLDLQERFLSEILGIKDLKIRHPGAIRERLSHQKVLVVFDDVENKVQLEALAARLEWFGAGSRIIVTTEDKNILDAYHNSYVYEMGYPPDDEAMQIFCQSAFGQSFPPDGFRELVVEVVGLGGNLPLGLKVLGSSLQGKNKDEWELTQPRLRTSLNGEIEKVLGYGYNCLEEKDQAIFRHIACLFTDFCYSVDEVISLLDDSDLNVEYGLNVLAKKCLINMHGTFGLISMNKLLRQVGREIVRKQSINPRKREFLVDKKDIEDVLTHNTDKKSTCLGISLCIEDKDRLSIHKRAFERMTNLQFLIFIRSGSSIESTVHLPQGLTSLPPKLRLLQWDYCPLKSLPPNFCPNHLVIFSMVGSKLEKLWEGRKPLGRLKWVDLSCSENLKEFSILSEATNLESLGVVFCGSLIEVPSPFALWSRLTELYMCGCEILKTFPHVPKCIEILELGQTEIEEVPSWIENLFRLRHLIMSNCKKLRNISSNVFKLVNLKELDFSGCENLESFSPPIESPKIPREKASAALDLTSNDFKSTPSEVPCKLDTHELTCSQELVELPNFPRSASQLWMDGCVSHERISPAFNTKPEMELRFKKCFKLNEGALQLIQESVCRYAILPGTKLPPYITHQTNGSSLTIRSDKMPISGILNSKPYLLLAAILNPGWKWAHSKIKCLVNGQHGSIGFQREWLIPLCTISWTSDDEYVQSEHLIIFRIFDWPNEDDVSRDEQSHDERVLEFICVPPENSEVTQFGVYQLPDSAYFCEKEESNTDAHEDKQSASDDLPSDIDAYYQCLLLF